VLAFRHLNQKAPSVTQQALQTSSHPPFCFQRMNERSNVEMLDERIAQKPKILPHLT